MTRPHLAIDDERNATTGLAWMRRIGRWRRAAIWLALPTALWCGGCGQSPQFAAKDLRLLEALRTAVSARKSEWLEASAKQIDKAHQQGTISDEGFEALQSSITEARAGDWKHAETQIIQLEKAQRPPAK
jgi:hypothetical protein